MVTDNWSQSGYGHFEPKWPWNSWANRFCMFAPFYFLYRNRPAPGSQSGKQMCLSMYIYIYIYMYISVHVHVRTHVHIRFHPHSCVRFSSSSISSSSISSSSIIMSNGSNRSIGSLAVAAVELFGNPSDRTPSKQGNPLWPREWQRLAGFCGSRRGETASGFKLGFSFPLPRGGGPHDPAYIIHKRASHCFTLSTAPHPLVRIFACSCCLAADVAVTVVAAVVAAVVGGSCIALC